MYVCIYDRSLSHNMQSPWRLPCDCGWKKRVVVDCKPIKLLLDVGMQLCANMFVLCVLSVVYCLLTGA